MKGVESPRGISPRGARGRYRHRAGTSLGTSAPGRKVGSALELAGSVLSRSRTLVFAGIACFVAMPTMAERQTAQALPDGVLREFAHGNPVDLAWWAPQPGSRGQRWSVLVLDGEAGTVSSYTANGDLENSFGSSGSGQDQLLDPQGLATDDELIYVADTGNDRIQVFDRQGKWIRSIGQSGSEPGELKRPRDVTISDMEIGHDLLVVADTLNDRLSIFNRAGEFKRVIPFARPHSVVAPVSGGVLLLQAGTNALFRAYRNRPPQPYENILASWSGARIRNPVDVERWNSLYLADAGSNQVVVFDRNFQVRRRIVGFSPSPRALLHGKRNDADSVYVANGQWVTEVSLVTDSPLLVYEAFRLRLASGDVDGALTYIHPSQRPLFRQMLEQIRAELPAAAEQMKTVAVHQLRPEEAVLMIQNGGPQPSASPIRMVRGDDGSWQVWDF